MSRVFVRFLEVRGPGIYDRDLRLEKAKMNQIKTTLAKFTAGYAIQQINEQIPIVLRRVDKTDVHTLLRPSLNPSAF